MQAFRPTGLALVLLALAAPAAAVDTLVWDGDGLSDAFSWRDALTGNTNWKLAGQPARPVAGGTYRLQFSLGAQRNPLLDLDDLDVAGLSFDALAVLPMTVRAQANRSWTSSGNFTNLSAATQTISVPTLLAADQTWRGANGRLVMTGGFDPRGHQLTLINATVNPGATTLNFSGGGKSGLLMSEAATLQAENLYLGGSASSRLLLSGAQTQLNLSGFLDALNGTLRVEDGAQLRARGLLSMGLLGAGQLDVQGAGSRVQADALRLAEGRGGSLSLLDGAQMVTRRADLLLGGGGAQATLHGTGTRWDLDADLTLGQAGAMGTEAPRVLLDRGAVLKADQLLAHQGSVQAAGGSVLDLRLVTLGVADADQASLVLDGAGTRMDTTVLRIGSGLSSTGSAQMTVSGGAQALVLATYSGGLGQARLQVTGAGTAITGDQLWLTSRESGSATFVLDNGATATMSLFAAAGDASGAGGTMEVGAGARLVAPSVSVLGGGRLLVRDGGRIDGQVLLTPPSALGQAAPQFTITGAGSRAVLAGFTEVRNGIRVEVRDGAEVGGWVLRIGDHGVLRLDSAAMSLRDRLETYAGSLVELGGDSVIDTAWRHQGQAMAGPLARVVVTGMVTGNGSFALGTMEFLGGYAPGFADADGATSDFGGGTLLMGGAARLELRIHRDGHDRVSGLDRLDPGAGLRLLFDANLLADPGTRWDLLDFGVALGQWDADHIEVVGFDRRRLDFSRLAVDGSIAVVPEPASTLLLAIGGAMLLWARRRGSAATARP